MVDIIEPLGLSVKCKSFRDAGDFDKDASFKDVKQFVKQRDKNACVHCGDVFEKYQEVHHKDDDHSNNDQDNLLTVCSLCHACHHIGLAGIHNRGVIAYMPEVTQEDINRTQKLLMCITRSGFHAFNKLCIKMAPYTVASVNFQEGNVPEMGDVIADRVRVVEEEYCKGWSNPTILGEALLQCDDEVYSQRSKIVSDLRLIPVISGYTDQVSYWTQHFSKTIPLKTWESQLEQNMDKVTAVQ